MEIRSVKLITGILIATFTIGVTSPLVCNADSSANNFDSINTNVDLINQETILNKEKNTNKTRVVVSMGDSYSSGEGITPFYGDSNPGDDMSNLSWDFREFLAHRSKKSWPGLLELSGKKKLNNYWSSPNQYYVDKEDVLWYFVASSGAETKDICGDKSGKGQIKTFSVKKNLDSFELYDTYLAPQINILYALNENDIVPDYITLTLGGNDVGFEKIVEEAAKGLGYQDPCKLTELLNKAQEKLDNGSKTEKSVREKLKQAYRDINNAVKTDDKQPCILVAGYPYLIDPNSKEKKIIFFDKTEADLINEKIDYFDDAIAKAVEECREDGIDIWFVDVRDEFSGHEPYTKDPWINGIKLLGKLTETSQDIDHSTIHKVYNEKTANMKTNIILPVLLQCTQMLKVQNMVMQYVFSVILIGVKD